MADKKAATAAAQTQSDKPKKNDGKKKVSFFDKVKNFFKGIGKYFKDTKSELKKVVWPSKNDVKTNTITVIVVVLIAVAIVGRLLRKVFHFAGFGIPDHLLGVAVSAAKTLLVLGLLFSAFESLNKDHTLAEEKTLDRSVCYRPMIRLADSLFPLLEWAKEQVSIDEQELWSDNSPER